MLKLIGVFLIVLCLGALGGAGSKDEGCIGIFLGAIGLLIIIFL